MRIRHLAVVAIVVGFGLSFSAQGARNKVRSSDPGADKVNELNSLREVYYLLKTANRDYKGHRVKALHAVEGACHELGAEADAENKGHESRASSDTQLRHAMDLLNEVRDLAAADKQGRLLKHVNEARNEVDEAMKVR